MRFASNRWQRSRWAAWDSPPMWPPWSRFWRRTRQATLRAKSSTSAAATCYDGPSSRGVRLVSVGEAAAAIPDSATTAVDGFTRMGVAAAVYEPLDAREVNQPARDHAPDYVAIERIDGQDFMFYRSFKIDVGIFRASSVDQDGNCSLDDEAVTLDALAIAQAARNSRGTVICQAKKLVPRGAIPPRHVTVPGALVDLVVQAPDPERQHRQTNGTFFDPVYISASSGSELPQAPYSSRLVIGRRAIRFLHRGDVGTSGTGIPGDTGGPALDEAARSAAITLA